MYKYMLFQIHILTKNENQMLNFLESIQFPIVLNSKQKFILTSVQFSSVAQSCLTLCNPMNCSMPGLPVHHQLPEFTQTHVHRVGDAIQLSHPLLLPSPPAPNTLSIRVFYTNLSHYKLRKIWKMELS